MEIFVNKLAIFSLKDFRSKKLLFCKKKKKLKNKKRFFLSDYDEEPINKHKL
jgi:hypothetical protein